tara:strand:+ start:165 stop:500 length:336 start_codon:yes stop_codon:yes gene_type:complete
MGVTGYMGGKTHDTTRRTSELPVRAKSKPGHSPKIGSRIISIIKGKQFTTEVTANTVYDKKGFPILEEENGVDISVLEQPNPVQRLITPNAPRLTPNTSTNRSSGYSGGGY